MADGVRLFNDQRYEEALQEFLISWDSTEPSFFAVKVSFLVGYLSKLSQVYVPTIDAMRHRIQELKTRFDTSVEDSWSNTQLIRQVEAIERDFPMLRAESKDV
jgi:hypothetical protein